jgi:RNA polymerase sigma-70 factor (ECF subfamily)
MYNEVEGEKAGSMDDRRLVEQSAKSDMNAFRLLILRYQRMVFSYLGHFLFPSQVIEDLSQETFMRAFRNISDFDFGRRASFSTWLITIARNLAINERAKAMRRKEYLDGVLDQDRSGDEHGPQQILEKRRLKARIHAAINRLPEQFHTAVVLSYFKELSLEEIAAIEGCREGTVKSRIFRGKQLLRQILESEKGL